MSTKMKVLQLAGVITLLLGTVILFGARERFGVVMMVVGIIAYTYAQVAVWLRNKDE